MDSIFVSNLSHGRVTGKPAVDAFLARNTDFVMEEPGFAFNEGAVRQRVTYWPKSFLRRR